jgi:hypothetical protein
VEALEALIVGAAWFVRCGQFVGDPDAVPLSAVASADTWDWLPTDRAETDPVHGRALIAEADEAGLGAARRAGELSALRWALAGLRDVPEPVPALVDGPHDYTLAARYGAEFAVRMAAREAVVGRPAFWWRVVELFAAGYWPCGRVRADGSLVVL